MPKLRIMVAACVKFHRTVHDFTNTARPEIAGPALPT